MVRCWTARREEVIVSNVRCLTGPGKAGTLRVPGLILDAGPHAPLARSRTLSLAHAPSDYYDATQAKPGLRGSRDCRVDVGQDRFQGAEARDPGDARYMVHAVDL